MFLSVLDQNYWRRSIVGGYIGTTFLSSFRRWGQQTVWTKVIGSQQLRTCVFEGSRSWESQQLLRLILILYFNCCTDVFYHIAFALDYSLLKVWSQTIALWGSCWKLFRCRPSSALIAYSLIVLRNLLLVLFLSLTFRDSKDALQIAGNVSWDVLGLEQNDSGVWRWDRWRTAFLVSAWRASEQLRSGSISMLLTTLLGARGASSHAGECWTVRLNHGAWLFGLERSLLGSATATDTSPVFSKS